MPYVGYPLKLSPVNEFCGISVDDISVIVIGSAWSIPDDRDWPVHFISCSSLKDEHVSSKFFNRRDKVDYLRHYVLCGVESNLMESLDWVRSNSYPLPLYLVSNSTNGRLNMRQYCVSSLDKHQWEETVALICSLHLSTIPQMIVRQAKKCPQSIALRGRVKDEVEMTYSQLIGCAWRLGKEIMKLMLALHSELPDNPMVGVTLPASPLSAITLLALGLHRLGAVVIASKPSELTAYQLSKVRCHSWLVLSDAVLTEEEVSRTECCVIKIDQVYHSVMKNYSLQEISEVVAPSGQCTLSDVCVVEWTSGSTGKPKAIAVTAWRLAHWIRWRQFHFPMSQLGSCVGVGLFWAWYWHIPLCQGGCMVIIPDELTVDVVSMVEYLARHRVDWVDCLTPGQLNMMTELVDKAKYPILPVRHIMSSGEALPIAVASAFLSRFPTTSLSNVLSTTETAADISCLKNVTLHLCQQLAKEKSLVHVPVLEVDEERALVVWGNLLGTSAHDPERLMVKGWNIQPEGYFTGEHVASFEANLLDGEEEVDDIEDTLDGVSAGCFLTGDRIVWREVDNIRYGCVEGRLDDVVKIRGFRVDLAGVEACLVSCPAVYDAVALSHEDSLFALVVLTSTDQSKAVQLSLVSEFMRLHMPPSSVPALVEVSEIKFTKTGKKDRKNMVKLLPQTSTLIDLDGLDSWSEGALVLVMQQHLGVPVAPSDNFFDLGGNSFKALRVCRDCEVSVALFFAFPIASLLAAELKKNTEERLSLPSHMDNVVSSSIVCGMGVRLPGATSLNEFWRKISQGQVMTENLTSGHEDHSFVMEKGCVNSDGCGAAFGAFESENGVSPLLPKGMSVASHTSIEQRMLLEVTYEALEDAGFDPLAMGNIRSGVFLSGGSLPHLNNLDELRVTDPAKYFALEIGHDKDYLAAAVAWAFDLRGPAEVIATACSSSLVAVSRAIQAIRLGLCDGYLLSFTLLPFVAIAGGASFSPDEAVNHVEGMIWSKSGCRPFCDDADGTVPADGAAAICLVSEGYFKSHQSALTPPTGELNRYCVVEGSAVNNDGRQKSGFCQPSLHGQMDVMRTALADAKRKPYEMDYVEAHGTGTRIGDPIEIEALSQVYCNRNRRRRVVVGSLKGNIGHLNTASGIAGFVKTALCLKFGSIPSLPSHQSSSPPLNTLVNWSVVPLMVATPPHIQEHFDNGGTINHAVVSAFGIGGTNACVVMKSVEVDRQEVANIGTEFDARPVLHVTEATSKEATESLLKRCIGESRGYYDDLAFEAKLLKKVNFLRHKPFRSFQVLTHSEVKEVEAVDVVIGKPMLHTDPRRPVVLVFPGQGGAYDQMGNALVRSGLLGSREEFKFNNWMSAEAILTVSLAMADAVTRSLPPNSVVACVGHSFGEWVAATYCESVSREDAHKIAMFRDGLVASLANDDSCMPLMLSIRTSVATCSKSLKLPRNLSVCIVNGPSSIVVGGWYVAEGNLSNASYGFQNKEIDDFLCMLDDAAIAWRVLSTTTAFHTPLVDSLIDPLHEALTNIGGLRCPSLPVVSSVTGDYVKMIDTNNSSAGAVADFSCVTYWSSQIRAPVRFDKALETIARDYPSACFVEVGPSTLAGLIKQTQNVHWDVWPILKYLPAHSLSSSSVAGIHAEDPKRMQECRTFLKCLGNLFVHCQAVPAFTTSKGSSAPLPPYDFSIHKPSGSSRPSVASGRKRPLKTVPKSVSDDGRRQTNNLPLYSVQWEVVEGGIAKASVPILPVLVLEHELPSSTIGDDRHSSALAFLQRLNLEAEVGSYFLVSKNNVVEAAQKHNRLAIVAGISSPSSSEELSDVTSLCQCLIEVLQQLSGKGSHPMDLFMLLDSNPRYAGLRGLLRSCRAECPHFKLRSVTLESSEYVWPCGEHGCRIGTDYATTFLPAVPTEVYVDCNQKCYQCRVKPLSSDIAKAAETLSEVLAVVTGGLSGVGLNVAKHLLVQGVARHVLLLGRTQRASSLLDEVIRLGATVVLCDVSLEDDVCNLCNVIHQSQKGKVELIVHCAGVIADEILLKVNPQSTRSVMAPKVNGTLLLRRSFPNASLVCFSSTSSVLGVVGQATYAAANSFMDEMSTQWSSRQPEQVGGKVISVQWGGWGEVGMAVDHRISPLPGEHFCTAEQGMCVLDQAITSFTQQIDLPSAFMALDVDWPLYADNEAVTAPPSAGNSLLESVVAPGIDNSVSVGLRSLVGASVVSFERAFGGPHTIFGERPDMAHVVEGVAILPASSYISWALEAIAFEHNVNRDKKSPKIKFNQNTTRGKLRVQHRLSTCRFVKPLVLNEPRRCLLVISNIEVDGGFISVSCDGELHATMKFEWPKFVKDELNLSTLVDSHNDGWQDLDAPYDLFRDQGFAYGPSFSRLRSVQVRDSSHEARAKVLVGQSVISPGVIDSSLQLISLCEGGVMGVPTAIESVVWYTTFNTVATNVACSHLEARSTQRIEPSIGSKLKCFDISLNDDQSSAVMMISNIELFPLTQQHHSSLSFCRVNSKVEKMGINTLPQIIHRMEELKTQVRSTPLTTVNIKSTQDQVESKCDEPRLSPAAVKVLHHSLLDQGLLTNEDGIEEEELKLPTLSNTSTCSPKDLFVVKFDADGIEEGVWLETSEPRPELECYEVEIQTSCWALNFRDVLVARGAIPMDTGKKLLGIGGECGGIVVRVGSGVNRVKVGDQVVAVPPDGMGSFVITRQEFVSPPLPWKQDMVFVPMLENAASSVAAEHASEALTPSHISASPMSGCQKLVAQTLVYATAWLGLEWQARTEPEDVVLIHSAAGGVGLAALFLLKRKGCVIYATASTEKKRSLLKALGCHGVFDSRNPSEFTAGIREAEASRNGEYHESCIDVVLNSLAGEAASKSLLLLRSFGRFVELGKRSSYENESLSMNPFLKGLTLSAAHVDVLMLDRIALAGRLFQEVWRVLPTLPALPQCWFSMEHINQGLDFMAKGVHIGKISILNATTVNVRETISVGGTINSNAPFIHCFIVTGCRSDPVTQSIKQFCAEVIPQSPPDALKKFVVLKGTLSPKLVASMSAWTTVGLLPDVVLAQSGGVAALAEALGVGVVVELRRWLPLQRQGAQDLLRMVSRLISSNSRGSCCHVRAKMPSLDSYCDMINWPDLEDWLISTVSSLAGGAAIDSHTAFEDYGVDSLAQINLARRISVRTGVAGFGVGELLRHPTVASTIECLKRTVLKTTNDAVLKEDVKAKNGIKSHQHSRRKQRVLCFHGFRSSGELLQVSLSALLKTLPSVSWNDVLELEFVTAPHPSSGPTDPNIPKGVPTFEWWSHDTDKSYEIGWTMLGDSGKLDISINHVVSVETASISPVVGLIGFSQGAAMACHLAKTNAFPALKWVACFSAVPPQDVYLSRGPSPDGFAQKMLTKSLHCFDLKEEHALLCGYVTSLFEAPVVIHHSSGHSIPKQKEVAQNFYDFISNV